MWCELRYGSSRKHCGYHPILQVRKLRPRDPLGQARGQRGGECGQSWGSQSPVPPAAVSSSQTWLCHPAYSRVSTQSGGQSTRRGRNQTVLLVTQLTGDIAEPNVVICSYVFFEGFHSFNWDV